MLVKSVVMNKPKRNPTVEMIGKLIRSLRKDRGIKTTGAAAEKLGMSRSQYEVVERGDHNYGIEMIIKTLDAYGVDIIELLKTKAPKINSRTKGNPVVNIAHSQLEEILASGGEDAEAAQLLLRRWSATLRNRKRQPPPASSDSERTG